MLLQKVTKSKFQTWQASKAASQQSKCTGIVFYGYDNQWTTKVMNGAYQCVVSTFGGDPNYGKRKQCRCYEMS